MSPSGVSVFERILSSLSTVGAVANECAFIKGDCVFDIASPVASALITVTTADDEQGCGPAIPGQRACEPVGVASAVEKGACEEVLCTFVLIDDITARAEGPAVENNAVAAERDVPALTDVMKGDVLDNKFWLEGLEDCDGRKGAIPVGLADIANDVDTACVGVGRNEDETVLERTIDPRTVDAVDVIGVTEGDV